MTRARKGREFRNPDTVAYLRGLSADEAAVQPPLVHPILAGGRQGSLP
ncbi:MAG: hypothetical protein OXF56_07645 [Rhodobacteraceae bacterium]|nr:hypothetical protein [Paracoccaceae bacterium]